MHGHRIQHHLSPVCVSGSMASTRESAPRVFNSKVAHLRRRFPSVPKCNLRDVLDGDDALDPNGVYVGRAGVVFVPRVEEQDGEEEVESPKPGPGKKERYPKRGSVYANPFKVTKSVPRDVSIALYRDHILGKIKADPAFLEPLRGKNLYCWCAPQPCHADVLLELLSGPSVGQQTSNSLSESPSNDRGGDSAPTKRQKTLAFS